METQEWTGIKALVCKKNLMFLKRSFWEASPPEYSFSVKSVFPSKTEKEWHLNHLKLHFTYIAHPLDSGESIEKAAQK